MANFELKELRPATSNLLLAAENQVDLLNESEMSSIKGGTDLEGAANQIFSILGEEAGDFIGEQTGNVVGEEIGSIIGETTGDAVSAGLGDIFL